MYEAIRTVRPGLVLALITLLFGIGMGIAFGVAEDGFKGYVAQGIAAHPDLHDAKSQDKIWRYAQRAHFHAAGVGAFTLGLVLVTAFTGLREGLKRLTALLIGAGGLYALSWLMMFIQAPALGREPAHEALLTKLFVMLGTGSLLAGMAILFGHLLLGFGREGRRQPATVAA